MKKTRSVPRLLAISAAALAVLFVAGIGAGRLVDPSAPGGEAQAQAEPAAHEAMDAHSAGTEPDPVRGLAVAENGLRLVVLDPERERGVSAPLRFRIVGEDGPLTGFDSAHTKRMHLIVVRRDLTGFQHLHPRMAADGTWAVPLQLDDAGDYRVFADFVHAGEATTLASDLRVDGATNLVGLPAPAPVAVSDGGYRVQLAPQTARAGEPAQIEFEVTRGGQPVALQPYLGAAGHLVALREGDLAFLHVHPEQDRLAFMATFPSAGRYRLFLQFEVGGKIKTVAFTQEVK
ncbi:MAG TPA: hypothetical protein VHR18_08100 [Solirubrobacterales bacterium]|nr:hypothetical protein [Solirubrobacterales bacterium]